MYDKSFIEILGEWMDNGWKRVLLCYLLLAASGAIAFIFPPAVILGFVFIPVIFSFKRRDEVIIEKQMSYTNDNGEDPDYIEYTHFLSNGDKYVQNNLQMAISGDIIYLVYLEGTEDIGALYNGIEYTLAPDLPFIDKTVK